jgi:hypothetical protein
METIFKKGDKVFCILAGWGTVSEINKGEYPILVQFNGTLYSYKKDGRVHSLAHPTLSFTEYSLEGFSQKRPEPAPKKGQIVWVRDWEGQSWFIAHYVQKSKGGYYVTHRDPLSIHLNGSTYRYLTTKNPYANEDHHRPINW